MFAMPKTADLNFLVQGGQLYWAILFSNGSLPKLRFLSHEMQVNLKCC